MKTIKQTYEIKAPIQKVWQALTDSKIINNWGGGPAKMDNRVGTKFSLWGGDIHGKNLEVVENKKLVQDWISNDWKIPSKVTFTLIDKDGLIEVNLLHESVPDKEADEIADGWKSYYLGPIKEFLETGLN